MEISAAKIENILAEKTMTKSTLASRCGISRQNISAIIKRESCEPRTAGRIASGLGVTVDQIRKEA